MTTRKKQCQLGTAISAMNVAIQFTQHTFTYTLAYTGVLHVELNIDYPNRRTPMGVSCVDNITLLARQSNLPLLSSNENGPLKKVRPYPLYVSPYVNNKSPTISFICLSLCQ